MDFALTADQKAIDAAVRRVAERFDESYWLARDRDGEFPAEFHAAMAADGWLGIAMPEEVGGAGLGVVEAAIMMHAVANGPGAMAAASSIHMNIFGPHAISVFGTAEQKRRFLPDLIAGRTRACFAVTEPDAGLDTTAIKTRAIRQGDVYVVNGRKIWTSTAQHATKVMLLARTAPRAPERPTQGLTLFFTDLDRRRVTVREIDKMGRAAVDSNELFIDGLEVPAADRIGAEGEGFACLLHSLNPERVLVGAEAVGIGRHALARAVRYAKEREEGERGCGRRDRSAVPAHEPARAIPEGVGPRLQGFSRQEVIDVPDQGLDRGVAPGGFLVHRGTAEHVEVLPLRRGRAHRRPGSRRLRDSGRDVLEDRSLDLPRRPRRQVVREAARQQFVEDDPERIDVGEDPDRIAAHLFGRGVGRRHEPEPGQCSLGATAVRLERLGDPEVEQLHRPIGGDEDVRRLDVAMDDQPLVRVVDAVAPKMRKCWGKSAISGLRPSG